MLTIDELDQVPWNRGTWSGNIITVGDAPGDDSFRREDVDELLAAGQTPDDWDGRTVAIVRMTDGRIVAWESTWGPTGSGFREDAYGGDADIIVGATVDEVLPYLSERARELLEWRAEKST